MTRLLRKVCGLVHGCPNPDRAQTHDSAKQKLKEQVKPKALPTRVVNAVVKVIPTWSMLGVEATSSSTNVFVLRRRANMLVVANLSCQMITSCSR